MSKYGKIFTEETEKARNRRQEGAAKTKAAVDDAKARQEEARRPLVEKILPHLKEAASQLPARIVKMDFNPHLPDHRDENPHLMFQLAPASGYSPATAVYKFSLLSTGTLSVTRCDPQEVRNVDRRLLNKRLDAVIEDDITEIIRQAIAEFVSSRQLEH